MIKLKAILNIFISKFYYVGLVLSLIIGWQTFTTSSDSSGQLRETFVSQMSISSHHALHISLHRSLFLASSALVLRQPEIFSQAVADFDKAAKQFAKNPQLLDPFALKSIEQLIQRLRSVETSFVAGEVPSKMEVKQIVNLAEEIRVVLTTHENSLRTRNVEAQIQWLDSQSFEGWLHKASRLLVSVLLMFLTWTALKKEKAEKVIRASESLYKLLFASLAEGVILCLRDGTITYANDRLGKLLRVNPAHIVGRKFSDVYPAISKLDGEFYPFGETPIDLACEGGELVENMLMGVNVSKQRTRWFTVNAQSVFDETMNEAISAVISLTDVTKSVEDQMVIERQQEQIVQTSKMAALGEMAGGMAHEINNPLAIIQSKSDMLEVLAEDDEHVEAEDAKKLATQISSTVGRIAKIVRGLRTFAREGSADPFETVALDGLIEEVVELSRSRLEQEGVRFELSEVPTHLNLSCRATQIEQVLLNLLNNARDAIASYDDKWVQLSFEQMGPMIQIHVTDCGPGIPKSIADKIFQPFFTTKSVGKGTGLGMSISKGIIESHKGRLFVDEDHPNTRFVAELPVFEKEQSSNDSQEESSENVA